MPKPARYNQIQSSLSSSSLTRSQLGPQRRSRVTATNSLPPQSRNGYIVVIAAELVGPFGTWSTWWTFPCRVWGSTDRQLDLACAGMLSGNLATCPNVALRPLVIRSDTIPACNTPRACTALAQRRAVKTFSRDISRQDVSLETPITLSVQCLTAVSRKCLDVPEDSPTSFLVSFLCGRHAVLEVTV